MSLNLTSYIASLSKESVSLLSELISFRSTAGCEYELQTYLAYQLDKLGFKPRMSPMHPDIESDEDYTPPLEVRAYTNRVNLGFTITGTGGGRSIILNTHVDVVPAPEGLFKPVVEHGKIKGRGACDAKGQVVTILLALLALREAEVTLEGDVIVQFVAEEEIGGNGTLSFILDGSRADGVVVFEPTNLDVHPANRGAIWFKLTVEGKATHMGRWRDGVNAIEEMLSTISVLKEYEQWLIKESEGDPLFPDVAANVKINFGTIKGGTWPSMVAGNCVLEGGIGFLPNKSLADIRHEVREHIEAHATEWTRQHYALTFDRLHNEAYRISPNHPLPQTLHDAATSAGVQSAITGFPASCDARLFYHRGGMPTVVFGPGDFKYAHALDEQISIESIETAATILADFLIRWCGSGN